MRFFPAVYTLVSTHLAHDQVVRIKGRLSREKDQPELHGLELSLPDLHGSGEATSGPLTISAASTRVTADTIEKLQATLAAHPGGSEVFLKILRRDTTQVMKLGDNFRVAPSPALFADLKQLLGPGCLS